MADIALGTGYLSKVLQGMWNMLNSSLSLK